MPTKKKPKPRFDVSEAVEATPQSGWVYRSEERAAKPLNAPPTAPPKPIAPEPAAGLVDGLAVSVAYGMAAAGHLFVIGTRVIAMPITIGLRLIGWR